MSARRGLIANVVPEDAMVYVNGVAIGEARQFNTVDKVYDFPAEGPYTVRVSAPGYKDAQFVITASDNAKRIARIDAVSACSRCALVCGVRLFPLDLL
jgi:hypothetical protein